MSLKWKPSDSTLFLISGRRRRKIAVDEDEALRRNDEVRGEVAAAHVIKISRDAEGRERARPVRRVARRMPRGRTASIAKRTSESCEFSEVQWDSEVEVPCCFTISMARSRWTPREPLTRTTSPARRFCLSHWPAASASGRNIDGHAASAGRRGQMFGIALHADNQIEAGLGRGSPAGSVQRGPVLAQLQHFAGDQDAAAAAGRAASVWIMERSASGLEL